MTSVAFIFPGQGSQYVGMGAELCEHSRVAAAVFEEANDVLGYDISKLCFDGNIAELTKTEHTQPAILTASVAANRVYASELGLQPGFCAGHSLGEYSALVCSGAIAFADALKMVRRRGMLMQEAVPLDTGSMAAITGVSEERIKEVCEDVSTPESYAVISNYNTQEQLVISGYKDAVQRAGEALAKDGATVIPLRVSAPFHSPLMKQVAELYREELLQYQFHDLNIPVISNVTALPYPGKDSIIDYLIKQIESPVAWKPSIQYLLQQGVDAFIEVGPKDVLAKMVRAISSTASVYAFDFKEEMERFNQTRKIDEDNKLKLMTRCLAIAVCTKNTNWNDEEYRKGVIEPYRGIQKLVEDLEKEHKAPTHSQMEQALDMLKLVFTTKGTAQAEQKNRFEQIFNETGLEGLFPNFKLFA
ncbi:ACP S-malonyltransferase [Paenibacillus sp. FSL H8-0048]|uniref:ACP S-malonyltransferase n=1 Tax=Paenibacillus sp. FSL H8-0048 TaxID=2954508 RepID=UPI0030FB9BD8